MQVPAKCRRVFDPRLLARHSWLSMHLADHCECWLLMQVQKEDIELIAAQFDLDKKKSERCLRENKGDIKAALRSLLKV